MTAPVSSCAVFASSAHSSADRVVARGAANRRSLWPNAAVPCQKRRRLRGGRNATSTHAAEQCHNPDHDAGSRRGVRSCRRGTE